jgi:hypothetical protein
MPIGRLKNRDDGAWKMVRIGSMSEVRSPPGLFCFFLFHFPDTGRVRVGPKIWFDECITVKGEIIINFIIDGLCGRVRLFTTVG